MLSIKYVKWEDYHKGPKAKKATAIPAMKTSTPKAPVGMKAAPPRPIYKGHQDNFHQSHHRPSSPPVLENQQNPYDAAILKKLEEKTSS